MTASLISFNRPLSEVPHLDQLLGVWAIQPEAADGLVSLLQRLDLQQHLINQKSGGSSKEFAYRQDEGGVAVISLGGTLQKHASSFSAATSTVLARRDIRSAAADDSIGSILLWIESPGGTSAGTQELADEIAAAGLKKPVHAFAEDLCASAAYWVGSQSQRFTANEAALIGSIGTFAVVQDLSGMAEKNGIVVHVVKAGDAKGTGVPGTKVTDEQLAEIQRLVDSRNDFFLRGVSNGRKMTTDQVRALADGRVHPANESVRLGLIDAVATFDSALAAAKDAARQHFSSKGKPQKMSTTAQSNESVATPKEIKAACPGVSSDFVLQSIEAGMTLAECKDAFFSDLAKQNAELTATNSKLTEELATLKASASKPQSIGTQPLLESAANGSETASAKESYFAKVKEIEATGKSRSEAMNMVNRAHPALRTAMVEEANAKRR